MTVKINSFFPPFLFNLKNDIIHRKFRNYSLRKELQKQVQELPELKRLFPEERIRKHYVYEPVRDTEENPDLYITQLRFYWYYKFFKKNYPDIFDKKTKVLDVGGTSGIILKSINKKGTVLNINQECVDDIKKEGFDAILGDAEKMDLPSKSFDYIFCFQMLEHVPNPLRVLNELGRVARKSVFISIPYVTKTKIYNRDYWINLKQHSWKVQGDVKKVDCHIFEFSTEDLKNLLSFSNMQYEKSMKILYFNEKTPFRRYYNKYRGSYFNFFVLKPRRDDFE